MADVDFQPKAYRREVLKPLLNGETVDDLAVAGIPLEAADDDEAVAARVAALRAFLAKEQANPRYGAIASTVRKRVEQLTPTLLQPRRRAALVQTVRDSRAAADGARFAKLDGHIAEFVRRFGGVPAGRIPRLKALLADELTPEEIDDRLAGQVLADDTPSEDGPIVSDTVRRLVRRRLRSYGGLIAEERGEKRAIRTLYDFLELPPGVPAGDIALRRDQMEMRNRQRRHDRLRTVTDELLSYTTQLLVDPGPAAYREVMAADAVEELKPEVERIVLFDDRVSSAEFERLLRQTVEMGLPQDVAREVVTSTATNLGVPVETGAVVEYGTCRGCASAQPLDGRRDCSRCGTSLYEPCLRCRNTNPVSAARCGHCSFDLLGLSRAQRSRSEAEAALEAGRAAEAAALLRGLDEWTADVPGLATTVQQARDRIAEAEMIWARLSRALDDGNSAEARGLLDHLRRRASDTTGPGGLDVADAEARLEQASSAVAAALAELDGLDARTRERRVLQLVAEHGEVEPLIAALRDHPLQPATDVTARTAADGVQVSWTASSSPGQIVYEVIREALAPGLPPSRSTAGRTSQDSLLDGGPPSGQSLRYVVVAERFGITAPEAPTEELSVIREVRDLTATVHDGAVQLSWVSPTDAAAVEVIRQERATSTASERMIRTGLRGALDTDVQEGVGYRYTARVVYRPRVGPNVTSDGVSVAVDVAAPPDPPVLEIRTSATHVALSASTPPGKAPAELVVLRADGPPRHRVGSLVSAVELEQFGRRVVAAGPNLTDGLPGPPRWYLAAMAAGEQFVVGPAVAHPGCAPITDVRATQEGEAMRLRWRWPVGATRAQALVGPRPDPQPFQPGVVAASCTNTRYDIDDGLVVRGLGPGTHYICVIPQAQAGNERVPLPDPGEDSCTTYEHQ